MIFTKAPFSISLSFLSLPSIVSLLYILTVVHQMVDNNSEWEQPLEQNIECHEKVIKEDFRALNTVQYYTFQCSLYSRVPNQ